jgi:hypothetical protein
LNRRAIWNRVLHWSFAAILTTTCGFSARYMQGAAEDLDELTHQRRQALQSLRATRNDLLERRGRNGTDRRELQREIQSALSDPDVEVLFPGLHPVPRTTHAGLILQLLPARTEDG